MLSCHTLLVIVHLLLRSHLSVCERKKIGFISVAQNSLFVVLMRDLVSLCLNGGFRTVRVRNRVEDMVS